MRYLFSLLALGLSAHASAETVKVIELKMGSAVLEVPKGTKPGTEFVGTFGWGSKCTFKLATVKGTTATTDTSGCKSSLSLGQELKTPEVKPADSSATTATVSYGPSTNYISDLQYFPAMGKIYGSATYMRTTEALYYKMGGAGLGDFTVENQILSLEAGYGFTEKIMAAIELGYLINGDVTTVDYTPAYSRIDGKNKGITDPTFKGKYRLWTQEVDGWDMDLTGSFLLRTAGHQQGTDKTEGDGHRGGKVINLGAEIGRKVNNFGYRFDAQYFRIGPIATRDPDTHDENVVDNFNKIMIAANGQVDFMERFHVRGMLARIFVSGRDVGPERNQDSYQQNIFALGVAADVVPHKIVAELTTVHSLGTDFSATYSGNNLNVKTNGQGISLGVKGEF